MTSESETEAWARDHQACFELTPLVEMRGSKRIQVGFNVDLYAHFPVEKHEGEERAHAALEIWTRLRTILETAANGASGNARLEIDEMRSAAFMRQENKLQPEVNLRGRTFHAGDYLTPVTDDDRALLPTFEERLRALGLRMRNW